MIISCLRKKIMCQWMVTVGRKEMKKFSVMKISIMKNLSVKPSVKINVFSYLH